MNNEGSSMSLVAAPQMTFLKFFLKIIAGLGAGAVGTVLVLVIFLATSSVMEGLFKATEGDIQISPIVLFVLVFMVFLGSIGGNILGALFTYFVDRDKYQRIYSTIVQIIISNVVLLFLMVPTYFLAAGIGIETLVYLAALHFVLAAQVSNLTLEFIANPQYGLLGVYSTSVAIILSMVIAFALYSFKADSTVLLFAAPPLIWGSIGFSGGIVDAVYGWVARIWGVDFAATNTSYGRDYSAAKVHAQEEVEKQEEESHKDVSGSDFLNEG